MKLSEALDDVRRTNSGEDVSGVNKVDSNSKEDMDAFDQFGPKARKVLNDRFPIKWSAHKTLQAVKQMGADPVRHDDMIAKQLTQHADMVSRQLRTEELEHYVPDMTVVLEGVQPSL